MFRPTGSARQASINAICGYLVFFRVRSTHDLLLQLEKIMPKINDDTDVFHSSDTFLCRTEIFMAAVAAYSHTTEYKIKVPVDIDWSLFARRPYDEILTNEEKDTDYGLEEKHMEFQDMLPQASTLIDGQLLEDHTKVTHSYDQLFNAGQLLEKTSEKIMKIMEEKQDFYACNSVIFGAGDTGTTLWLEKYKMQHYDVYQSLAYGALPSVLIIGDSFGSWGHDYTLAQTHSSLERSAAPKNPSDFMSKEFYRKNPQVNARLVYQANQVCLANTEAPFVRLQMLKIEKRDNHDYVAGWESSRHPYRCIVQFPNGDRRVIYTNSIDVCTGLGPAKQALEDAVISPDEMIRLNQFDETLSFTPIVNGNQFVLTDSEEKKNGRSILIFGGGGTASACYRKCFFGTDIRTYDREFSDENQRNEVFWIYRTFIGTGRMAKNAHCAADAHKGNLIQITQQVCGKLCLEFEVKVPYTENTITRQFLCDQLVYAIGQDDQYTHDVCSEVSSDLQLNYDDYDMPLYISTKDKCISYFGASAVSFRKAEFNRETMSWLKRQHIGGDVGVGSMPPTRAQVKRHLSLHGVKPTNVNVNMDSCDLISEFFAEIGVKKTVIDNFIDDLLLARLDDTYGCSRATLKQLLNKYQLDMVVDIFGHSHLVLKGTPPIMPSKILHNFFINGSRRIPLPKTVDDTLIQSAEVYYRAQNLFSN